MSIYKVLELAQYSTDDFEEGVLIPAYNADGSLAEFSSFEEAEEFVSVLEEDDEDGEFHIAWVKG